MFMEMMKSILPFRFVAIALSLVLFGVGLSGCSELGTRAIASSESVYQHRLLHSPDGIGKIYMGREIAKVMGHRQADWLERDSRDESEQPDRLLEALDLQPDSIVADIGAGTGFLSVRLSQLVPEGKVFAVDIQPEMVDRIERSRQQENITNIEPILGEADDPNLPASSVDLALMVDTYHEFEYPREMMQGILQALKPGGRVVLAEYRAENPLLLIKRRHKMSEKQVKKEMEAVGLVWQETKEILPKQHLMFFQK